MTTKDVNHKPSSLQRLFRWGPRTMSVLSLFKFLRIKRFAGDELTLKAWRRICGVSRKEFDAIYARLGIVVNERGESFYNPMLQGTIDELKVSFSEFSKAL